MESRLVVVWGGGGKVGGLGMVRKERGKER